MLTVLRSKGFTLKDLVPPTTSMDLVGVRFDGVSLSLRNKPERVWKLIYAIREILRMRVVPGWVLRVVNGHLVNQFLINRCALSCLSDSFAFALQNLDKWARLPVSVTSELKICCGILPLVRADLGSKWVPWLLCSDSSDKGYALHASPSPTLQLADAGSWKENWRFKPISVQTDFDDSEFRGISAEEFSKAPTFESWIANSVDVGQSHRVRAPYRHHVAPLWLENPHIVPELTSELVEQGHWYRMLVGSWKFTSTIHMLEAKVALRGLHRVVLNQSWHGHKLISLGDNFAEVLALSAGRCKNKALNGVCRQAASLQLASGIRWHRRYISTHRNPSDSDSRLANAGRISGGRYFTRHVMGLDPDTRVSDDSVQAPHSACLVISAAGGCPYYYSFRTFSTGLGNDFCRYEDLANPVWESRLGDHIARARPSLLVIPWIPSGCLYGAGPRASQHRRSGHALARIVELALTCHCQVVMVSSCSRDPWCFSPIRRVTAGWQSVTLSLSANADHGLRFMSSNSVLLSHLLGESPLRLKSDRNAELAGSFVKHFAFPWHRIECDVCPALGWGPLDSSECQTQERGGEPFQHAGRGRLPTGHSDFTTDAQTETRAASTTRCVPGECIALGDGSFSVQEQGECRNRSPLHGVGSRFHYTHGNCLDQLFVSSGSSFGWRDRAALLRGRRCGCSSVPHGCSSARPPGEIERHGSAIREECLGGFPAVGQASESGASALGS
eukprot:5052931-Amphidinium_carterae.1